MSSALADVVVADFSRVLAGPYATMLLADLGATVIKIEHPERGDDTRSWGPPFASSGQASYYESVNRNKFSCTLNLREAADVATARAIVARSDVLVHNFKTGTMASYGLGYEQLVRQQPGLIYGEISGFGSEAGSALPGYDLLVQAVSGLMSITGEPQQPTKVGVALVDVLAGLHLATGILAALHRRQRSGEGELVQVNLLSSALASMVNQSAAFALAGVNPQAQGNAHPSIVPYQTFRTNTKTMVIAVGNDAQFRRLCQVLDRPELALDPRYVTNQERVHNRASLTASLQAVLLSDTAESWLDKLGQVGVPAGPINTVAEGFELATQLGLAPLPAFPDQTATVTSGLSLRNQPVAYRWRPPALGADNEVIHTWLRTDEPRPKLG